MNLAKPKVAVIGGGTGLPVLLKGLKSYPIDLVALVTVADDGGSSGGIREQFDIPAPGDIRNVITSLSEADPSLIKLFQHRFSTSNGLSGHSMGNLLLAALTTIKGSFSEGIQELSRVFKVKGTIYPTTNESIFLSAEMKDGSIVHGEANIPLANKEIHRLSVTPKTAKPIPEAIDIIRQADYIVISPGSLYTSILPNLIIPQMDNELKNTPAHIVYVCNIMTQNGETSAYKASDHIQAITNHIGENIVDTVIVNNGQIDQKLLSIYQREKSHPVENDFENLKKLGLTVVAENILDQTKQTIRHNTHNLSELIYKMINP